LEAGESGSGNGILGGYELVLRQMVPERELIVELILDRTDVRGDNTTMIPFGIEKGKGANDG